MLDCASVVERNIDSTRETHWRSQSTMNGTISQLHKGGRTNKTSNQRPVVLLNSGYQLLNYIINERLKRIVEQTNVSIPGQGGGPKCKHQHAKNACRHAWSPQTEKASLSSRHRLHKRLECNVADSCLARDEYVSYARRWLTWAYLRQRNSPSSSKWRNNCNDHVWYRCSARKHHVPATVQYLYQRSVVDAHGDWAKSGYQPWFVDWQELPRQQSRRRPGLSV